MHSDPQPALVLPNRTSLPTVGVRKIQPMQVDAATGLAHCSTARGATELTEWGRAKGEQQHRSAPESWVEGSCGTWLAPHPRCRVPWSPATHSNRSLQQLPHSGVLPPACGKAHRAETIMSCMHAFACTKLQRTLPKQ